jgi:hypothetical protein
MRTFIIDISKLSDMIFLNYSQKDLLVEKKIISLTYIKHTNKSFSIFLVKRVESTLSIIKPFPTRISVRHLYHALGAYLSL